MILPSKTQTERILFTLDFGDEMPFGSTISGAFVEISVFSGVDPRPELLFWAIQDIDGTTISVQIQAGLPGVIYNVLVTATSSGEDYERAVKLAVLPDTASIPPTFANWLTSHPYPVFILDGLDSSILLTGGILKQVIITYEYLEGIDSQITITGGQLRPILVAYTFTEGIDSQITLTTGVLRVILITYDRYLEGLDTQIIITAGVLRVILITYSNPVDGIDSQITITGGVLV